MPQPVTPAEQVFLSYSHADRQACVALRTALAVAGISFFRDEEAIRVGDRWLTRLQEALQQCSAFVLLVGRDGVQRWVGAELQVALARHLSPAEGAERLPIFPVLLDDASPEALPPFLALFQAVRWAAAGPVPEALLEAIRTRSTRGACPIAFEGCPFLGLSAFGRGDSRLFFGRRKETLEALACLGDPREANPERLRGSGTGYYRWLQIDGNSGAGKSSLVAAGMLPLIEQGALWARTGFAHWHVLGPMMPGREPLAKLAEVLELGLIPEAQASTRDSLALQQRFESDDRAFARRLRDLKQAESAFLLVLDQFEELFTFAEEHSRQRFDALLAHALQDSECPLFVISSVRVDFLDRFEQLPRLQAIRNSHCRGYSLPTISEHGLREVIEEPARLAGLDVREVSAAILDDARGEIGALPLVENALFTLWQQREGNRLSGERYRQAMGIAGILSVSADALLERIDQEVPQGRQAALELLLRLTRINDEGRHTRQRIARAEAVFVAGNGHDEVGERVLQLLAGERRREAAVPDGTLRLVTTSSEGERRYVDLIHETLIRARSKDERSGQRVGYWPTLYDYIEKNRDRDLHLQQLRFSTERWRGASGLGRLRGLAGWRDLARYRRLRVRKASDEGRFLRWSRWQARAQLAVLVVLLVFVGESFVWTRANDLPLDMMWTQQRYRWGYAPLPELVEIPAGSLAMGEQDPEFLKQVGEKKWRFLGVPSAQIAIASGFRLGRYEVSYEQFDYYVWEQQRADQGSVVGRVVYPTTAKGGRGTRPVVNVTWYDAAAYAKWFGERKGLRCRLPTEAEWEHAARAQTKTAYPWGDEVRRSGEAMANCRDCGSRWDNDQSAPVGSFPANAFGLHDTVGNVVEWTCSAWRNRYDGSERLCEDPKTTVERVLRGGAWDDVPAFTRSVARGYYSPENRNDTIGFRVLCSSPIE
ncbi:MAG: SUMF1/EgtB/PvdO family nonheme iron enzyme [Candidatus Accumulibacter sp.]|jgi:formylglycine-generating enzyme required for sulfatase activity|uniref:SUMF1/EgtB/PvdO family nonheme iron enzyme n=1 Tax=Candidatus Accumulibacter affinis TaxID=2954384 RepID=A0A935TAB1_9PROT|nr:SUMF1/EgtB/PvdO family nonheme iron enzyme [Candidatus Accumulibacter affinis]